MHVNLVLTDNGGDIIFSLKRNVMGSRTETSLVGLKQAKRRDSAQLHQEIRLLESRVSRTSNIYLHVSLLIAYFSCLFDAVKFHSVRLVYPKICQDGVSE